MGSGAEIYFLAPFLFVLTLSLVTCMAYVLTPTTEHEMNAASSLLERCKTARHVLAIMDEIDYLEMIIEPQDCGHMITTRNLLRDHVEAILKEMEK